MLMEYLMQDERIDEIGFGNLKLIQNPNEFCYGIDAVLLSHYAAKLSGKENDESANAFDLGTSGGIIPLILSAKTRWKSIRGVELQKCAFDRAERNRKLNRLEERLSFINSDIKDYEVWGKEYKGQMDIVTTNPPYQKKGTGIINDTDEKVIARHETTADLETFMKCSAYLLKEKGHLFMIHRPNRIVDISEFGRKLRLEPKELIFVSPKPDTQPNIMVIHFVKGGGKDLKILEPVIVHNNDDSFTETINNIYRGGEI